MQTEQGLVLTFTLERQQYIQRAVVHLVFQAPGEQGNCGRLEQGADTEPDIQPGSDPIHQPGSQQRMPTDLEEVIVDADTAQLQNRSEQLA